MGGQVSEQTTNRLSLYLRFANELDANGVRTVSSKALAAQFDLNAALIRKDLSHFGALGVRAQKARNQSPGRSLVDRDVVIVRPGPAGSGWPAGPAGGTLETMVLHGFGSFGRETRVLHGLTCVS